MVYIRIRREGLESRKRVEEIEKSDSYSTKLIHAVADLERQMDDKVTDFIDIQTTSQEKPSKEKEEEKWWVPCSSRWRGEHACFCSCRRKKSPLSPEAAASERESKQSDDKKTKGGLMSLFKRDSRAPSPDHNPETSESTAQTDPKAEGTRKCKWSSTKKSQPKMDVPALLDVQKEMIERLNKLRDLKKERGFYDDTRNSHSAIVCRADREFISEHVDSTLRYWADSFVF